jgi:hypothetical protein
MGKNFSKNQHFADFSACSGHPGIKLAKKRASLIVEANKRSTIKIFCT